VQHLDKNNKKVTYEKDIVFSLYPVFLFSLRPSFGSESIQASSDTVVECVDTEQSASNDNDKSNELASRCCRRCSTGKPCGNSCIAKNKACHRPPDCACSVDEGDGMFGAG